MPEETAPDTAKKSGLKTIIMVAGIVVVEAVAIVGIMSIAGGPDEVRADPDLEAIAVDEGEKICEVLVLDAKLPNNRSGVTYLFDTEIYVQVKQKHADRVTAELDQFQNEIKAEIAAIWRMTDPDQFREAKLQTLTRKVEAWLDERYGRDEATGEAIVSKCVIIMGTGFRIDS
jgi:hypothetical protein